MPDWRKIVREKLSPLPLTNGRTEEVIEELAQQLESAYDEARAAGASEADALFRSLEQIRDWEKLRREITHAVNDAPLPIWQHKGLFSPRRAFVWLCFVLSFALVLLSAFRQALTTLPFAGAFTSPGPVLDRLAQEAAERRDARSLAFVALYHPDGEVAMRAADQAIALDPGLTWISARFGGLFCTAKSCGPVSNRKAWIGRLESWDPDNAVPYLFEAAAGVEPIVFDRWPGLFSLDPRVHRDSVRKLAAENTWRVPMEKAFAAPRYEDYATRAFNLNRSVFQQQRWNTPYLLFVAAASMPLPDFSSANWYADYLLGDPAGNQAKSAGAESELANYHNVLRFAERMQGSETNIERMIGMKLREKADERLAEALRRQQRLAEASAYESDRSALQVRESQRMNQRWYQLRVRASIDRATRWVRLSGALVSIFVLFGALWVLIVAFLAQARGAWPFLNRFAVATRFVPALFFVSCLSLLAAYYPHFRPLGDYASREQIFQEVGPFATLWEIRYGIGVTMMFWPVVWCVVVAVLGGVALRLVARRHNTNKLRED